MTTPSLVRVNAPGSAGIGTSGGDRRQSLSLYGRVVVVNTAILLAAVLVLVLTPATVSFPMAAEQGLVLGLGVVGVVLVDAVLVRVSFRGLAGLVRRMETLDLLRSRERLAENGGRETRALIAGFNAMLDRLEHDRLASTHRTLSVLEDERRRIGQELHDEVGQRITGVLLQLGRIHEDAPEWLKPRIAAVQEQERATLDEVGALAWQVRPGILEDLGLLSALDALVASFEEHADARVVAVLPPRLPDMAPEVELGMYRVAQEALTNAVRHAHASRVTLEVSVDSRSLSLRVVDDGSGLTDREADGPGMRGMRERTLLIGGSLSVESPHGQGVRVQLDVPRDRLTGR